MRDVLGTPTTTPPEEKNHLDSNSGDLISQRYKVPFGGPDVMAALALTQQFDTNSPTDGNSTEDIPVDTIEDTVDTLKLKLFAAEARYKEAQAERKIFELQAELNALKRNDKKVRSMTNNRMLPVELFTTTGMTVQ